MPMKVIVNLHIIVIFLNKTCQHLYAMGGVLTWYSLQNRVRQPHKSDKKN